jgi:hypothetical protein
MGVSRCNAEKVRPRYIKLFNSGPRTFVCGLLSGLLASLDQVLYFHRLRETGRAIPLVLDLQKCLAWLVSSAPKTVAGLIRAAIHIFFKSNPRAPHTITPEYTSARLHRNSKHAWFRIPGNSSVRVSNT